MAVQYSLEPKKLIEFISTLPSFEIYTEIDGNYNHIGATLADAVLQSNNNYESNVRHRIKRIRETYADTKSLQDLIRLLDRLATQEFLNWRGTRKPKTFMEIIDLLRREGVDTEDQLRVWLATDNAGRQLLEIRFVGKKTIDYLKILVGLPVAAMDRHLVNFLEDAGFGRVSYEVGQDVIHRAAYLMELNPAHLDHSIWRHMSGKRAAASRKTTCL